MRRARRELGQKDGGDDEGNAVAKVTEDQGPAATSLVDEHHAEELSDEGNDGGDGLVAEGLITGDANLLVDCDGVVLDGTDTGHLNGSLESASEEETTEARLVGEELLVRLCGALVLGGDGILDLVKLGADPGIVDVAVSVKLGQGGKTLVKTAVVDEPTRRLGEEENKQSQNATRNTLDTQTDAPLVVVVLGKPNVCSV